MLDGIPPEFDTPVIRYSFDGFECVGMSPCWRSVVQVGVQSCIQLYWRAPYGYLGEDSRMMFIPDGHDGADYAAVARFLWHYLHSPTVPLSAD